MSSVYIYEMLETFGPNENGFFYFVETTENLEIACGNVYFGFWVIWSLPNGR